MAARPNPGPFTVHNGRITFERSGRTFAMTRRVVSAAAHYLASEVKTADHRGTRPPPGPFGMSPGEAGYILHHGEIHLRKRAGKRRSKACPPCRTSRKPARRRASGPARKSASRPAPAPAARSADKFDMWDYISERF